MRHHVLTIVLVTALGMPTAPASAQTAAMTQAGTSLGSIVLSKNVMADGRRLAAGTYQVRLTGELPEPVVGQSPDAAMYVEFLRAGAVVGRELAIVVSLADIAAVGKGQQPVPNGARVELLRGNDYLRVWINRGGTNYLINLPTAA